MFKERTITLPFSPKDHSLPARIFAIYSESLRPQLPTTIYTANDGELVAVTMRPPNTDETDLTGLPVSAILREVKTYANPFGLQQHDVWVTIYTGPQPPKPVGERVLNPASAI